jgi:filamentous hemagglutinin
LSNTTRHSAVAMAVRAALYGAATIAPLSAHAELPVPCVSGVCVTSTGAAVPGWVTSGNATATATGNVLDIKQLSDRAIFNWQTFNISPEAMVRFTQPDADSVALNRIFQGQSNISGTLTANGRVYLLNQNGIVFGQGARVNVAGLLASSLDMPGTVWDNGIASAAREGKAAFVPFLDAGAAELPSGAVHVQRNAEIATSSGGQVLMFAPEIVNQGRISTPDGQTLLAAGSQVYLATSSDANLRGLLVEVGTGGGTVTNGDLAQQVGEIVAERGNVTLAGLAVNQLGRVTATTTVRENGSIRLQARDGGSASSVSLNPLAPGLNTGELVLGRGSTTQVSLAGDEKAVDATVQQHSRIELQGRSIHVLEDAQVLAKGGTVNATAMLANPSTGAPIPESYSSTSGSRIYLARGARIDVSGATVDLPVERNVVVAELRGNELADSPVQRSGPLRGKAVSVDIREHGGAGDSAWQGTPLGDVKGQISLIERDVNERNLTGGSVNLSSALGDVVIVDGARIDVSGGQINYQDGYINTSKLLGTDGTVYDIARADPDRSYVGLAPAGITLTDRRWGVTETYAVAGSQGRFESGYVEGKDAGAVHIVAPQLVLDGEIRAGTVAGLHQRLPAQQLGSAGVLRPFDQLPLGGQLVVGEEPHGGELNRVAGDVVFGGSAVLPTLGSSGAMFDPASDALPDNLPIRLRTDLFGAQRIARADINSNDRVELPADVSLNLPGQGELHIAARQVEVAGDVSAPSGVIAMHALETLTPSTAEDGLFIRSGASLDVRGGWVNDSPLLNVPGVQLAPRLIDGGTISLSATRGVLQLAEGSLLDASGGGWARSNGRVVGGRAGLIELEAVREAFNRPTVDFNLGASLRAFGVDAGGALSISAPEICIGTVPCGSDALGTLWFDPATLIASGFADLSLASNERGLTVKAGTQFDLQQRNVLLEDVRTRSAPTGADIATLGSSVLLPDYLRAPMSLSLEASIMNGEGAYSPEQFVTLPVLSVEAGAAITGSPGATISLTSNTSLLVAGSLSAPVGTIDLSVNSGLSITGLIPSQGIWLDSTASLQAKGVAVLTPDPNGLRTGEVLDGGRISLRAGRGSVLVNAGAVVDVSGTSSTLDLGYPHGSLGDVRPTLVASNGGRIELEADRSMVLSGELRARAGEGSAGARGGALSVTLGSGAQELRTVEANEERTVAVVQSQPSMTVAPGSALPSFLARRATVAADAVATGGFSELTLRANTSEVIDSAGGSGSRTSPGQIEFQGNVDLRTPGRLQLDAAALLGNGRVGISSPYLQIGQTSTAYQTTSPLATRGAGALLLSGDFIDITGNSAIGGFGAVRLQSNGDLRLNGVQQDSVSQVAGSLMTDADLTLAADQVYASTLSDFAIAVQGNSAGVLRVESTGGERSAVLSAGSRLRLNAPTIEQSGVLRAPFGTIELAAETLSLAPGSLTSTAAEGQTIPFGTLQAGNDWVYGLRGDVSLVLGESLPVPQQAVALDAGVIDIAAGAVIDISGGGDLLGYEFIPGPTGKVDALSALERPGRFAVIPGLNVDYAPIDPQEGSGTLRPGDSIHLSAGADGLPAGDYVLLPARYALLPGAFVVEAQSGYTDLPTGELLRQLDGSAIVSGYRRTQGTTFADARTGGFAVRTAAQLAQEALFVTTRASQFFAAKADDGATVARLPQDAGVLALNAVTALNIDGALRASAAAGARGAAVDVSAQNLRVAEAAVAAPGEVVVSASDLQDLGAESILLGARRRSGAAGTTLETAASRVTVEADLSAAEIVIAASEEVRLASGAQLNATGDLPVTDRYLTSGDGAFLRVAAGEQTELLRTGETGTRGSLVLEEGAALRAPAGALAFDASLETRSAATLDVTGGALSAGARKINLGVVPESEGGLSLTAAGLAAAGAAELTLVSRTSIDVFGDFALQTEDLQLDTPELRGVDSGAAASITANGTLTLVNTSGAGAVAAPSGTGTLELSGNTLVLGTGAQRISGFATVRATGATQVRAEETGSLSVAGDLALETPMLLAGLGARSTILASGDMSLARQTNGATPPAEDTALGGKLALRAGSISVDTQLRAAAGQIDLAASTGDITLTSAAVLDAAGRTRDFDGTIIAAPAGRISFTATNGNVTAQAGSSINLAGAADGAAGTLNVSVTDGYGDTGGRDFRRCC